MKVIATLFAVLGLAGGAFAQQPEFKRLRYDDDFTWMKADYVKGFYKDFKYIPLGKKEGYYLSLGGEVRERYLITKNNEWGNASDEANGYILSRYLFHTDLHLGRFRVFAQFQSSLATGMDDPGPVDKNPAEVHQAFADYKVFDFDNTTLTIRAGRQEMTYGSQRLISVREIPNSRLSFDAVKILLKRGSITSDAFYSHPMTNIAGSFNDEFNKNAQLWGSYTVINNVPLLNNIDVYYLGLWKHRSRFSDITGPENRHSVGARIWKSKGAFTYDFEGMYQFGEMSGTAISAWTLSSNTTYTLKAVKFKPQFGLKTEIISGDRNRGDNKLQSFNAMYPRGAYFGLAALIGPANLYDLHPSIDFQFTDELAFGIDYDFFWRWSTTDGIYEPNMQMIFSGETSGRRHIGDQLTAEFSYSPGNFFTLTFEAAWFDAGGFIKDVSAGKDYLYGGVTAQFKF